MHEIENRMAGFVAAHCRWLALVSLLTAIRPGSLPNSTRFQPAYRDQGRWQPGQFTGRPDRHALPARRLRAVSAGDGADTFQQRKIESSMTLTPHPCGRVPRARQLVRRIGSTPCGGDRRVDGIDSSQQVKSFGLCLSHQFW